MDDLRKALFNMLAEDMDFIGEPTKWTRHAVEAWNNIPGVEKIDLPEEEDLGLDMEDDEDSCCDHC